jgi:CrcB protein
VLTVLVSLAGAIGALARYSADYGIRRWRSTQFPVATLAINVTGSLVLGLLTGLTIHHFVGSGTTGADAVTIAGSGFCGGYTTFSAATFESVRLVQLRRYRLATLNTLGSVVLTTVAAAVGFLLSA